MQENNDINALLTQISKINRKQLRWDRFQGFFTLVMILCLAAVIYVAVGLLPMLEQLGGRVDALCTQAETVLGNLETVTNELSQVDLETMVSDVGTLVNTSQEGLEETLENFNSIDFEGLNQAIGDLSEVVEPMAKVFKAFG